MPFKSSEIRWFGEDKEIFAELFDSLPKAGRGNPEPLRIDYYLQTNLQDTGIKIREGNHEIKVKTAPDELLDYGKMEHWCKWSNSENETITDTVPNGLLPSWVAVEKRRFKKSYAIVNGKLAVNKNDEFLKEGCGIEFTELHFPQSGKTFFTFGLEAFSSENHEWGNLISSLSNIPIDLHLLNSYLSCGYPEWLNHLSH